MPGKRTKTAQRTPGMAEALHHETTTKTPLRSVASQARRRGADVTGFVLGAFEEAFCFQMARINMPSRAHHAAELHTNTPLDLSEYTVHSTELRTKKGTFIGVRNVILTKTNFRVTEDEVRYAKAAKLLYYPEIRARIAQIKADRAAAIKVSAEQIAEELDMIMEIALEQGQLATAMQTRQTKAKMFGIEAGGANDATVTHRGGVMVVPGVCDVSTWGDTAAAGQAALKEEVKK